MGIAIAIAAIAYLAGVVALTVGQRWFIYRPPANAQGHVPSGFDRVVLHTEDGLELVAAYHQASNGRPTLVYFHGNADSLKGASVASELPRQRGYGVLLVEYRGYAGNSGKPTEDGLYRDGRAALNWLAERGIARSDVILVGYSLGSGIASQLAAEGNIGGLVLVSPFSRLKDVASYHFPFVPVRWLLWDRYATIDKLRGRHLRVLVLHGDGDRVIPWKEGRSVAEAIPGAKFELVQGAGHELAFQPKSQMRILAWLSTLRRRTDQ